jgi:hypothetical protein
MKAHYALVVVCMSLQAFSASAGMPDISTADSPSYYFDDVDFDIVGETTAQSKSRVLGTETAPSFGPDALIVDQDGAENYNMADTVPGLMTIPPSDDDLTGSFVDPWDGH